SKSSSSSRDGRFDLPAPTGAGRLPAPAGTVFAGAFWPVIAELVFFAGWPPGTVITWPHSGQASFVPASSLSASRSASHFGQENSIMWRALRADQKNRVWLTKDSRYRRAAHRMNFGENETRMNADS